MPRPPSPEQVFAAWLARRGAEPFDALLQAHPEHQREPWPTGAEVEAALARETLPSEANGLNSLAWPLVDVDPAQVM